MPDGHASAIVPGHTGRPTFGTRQAEFDGDPAAIAKIVEALRHGYTVEYVAERIRQDRAEAPEHERLRAELEAA